MPEVIDRPVQLVRVAVENNLPENSAAPIIEAFRPHFADAQALIAEAGTVTVTDPTQVSAMKRSRELRLSLKDVRVAAEKSRKTLKEESLRMGKAIDGMNNVLLAAIVPVEQRLQEQEDFAVRIEQKRMADLAEARRAMLAPYTQDTSAYNLVLMSESVFADTLNGLKLAHEKRIEEARKAEEARVEAEKLRAAEDARVRAENECLKREAEVREAAARIEREAAEAARKAAEAKAAAERKAIEDKARKERESAGAKLRTEREAREKLEREARIKADAEAKIKADAEKARKKAERAPDAEKLRVFANALLAIPLPEVRSEEAARIVESIRLTRISMAASINDSADSLGQ